MEFKITPKAKQLILNQGCQITVNIEREKCYSCAGQVVIPSLSAQLGRPKDLQLDEYEILSEDDIKIYVQNAFKKFDTSVTLAIDLSESINEDLVIFGVVPES